MYRQLSVAVVVPAFNEQNSIQRAVASIPEWVDRVFVIDDGSHDDTAQCASALGQGRVEVVRHGANRGVGGAILTGYRRARALGCDVSVVMAGDGQMDPADLPALLDPIADGAADYVKGDRFRHPDVWREMPWTRVVGNIALSLATKLTSGHTHVFDSQCGYTAITRVALEAIDLDGVFPRYGYPNDLLARLWVIGARVVDVPVRPIYGAQWRSGIRPHNVLYPVAYVLLRSWLTRLCARSGRKLAPEGGDVGARPGQPASPL
jgi:glycosyltransferase involved in cell wall biosynthesis